MSLDTILEQAVADGTMPGAVLFATNTAGTLNYQKVLGNKSLTPDTNDPVQPNSIFTIASMTKLLTTISALQLVERGTVTIDEDVSQHIPALAKQPILTGFSDDGTPQLEKRRNPITLRHLLTHSAGTGYDATHPPLKRYLEHINASNAGALTVDGFFEYPLLYQPGEGWSYGSSMAWAGKVVEKLSGKTLEEYFQENILAPLGLSRISFFAKEKSEFAGQLCHVAVRDEASGKLMDVGPGLPWFGPLKDCFGGEGAFADLSEYFKVVQSLLRDDGKLLKSETAQLMFEPQLPSDAARDGLRELMAGPGWMAIGDFTGSTPKEHDWGFGGVLVVGDGHLMRKKGCLIWGGAANTFWSVDREAGLCCVFGTQVLPPSDKAVTKVISAFEKYVYAEAATSK